MPDMSQLRSLGGTRPRLTLLGACLVGTLLLAGCGSTANSGNTGNTRTDPLTFSTTSVPVAYVGEDYQANLMVSGGVGPYGYRLASGALPPGLRFSNGTLSGKPTAQGAYSFTVEASDANLSNKVVSYTLNVNELPPLSLEATLPGGEIRGETRIPVLIKAPRSVRAASFTWDVGENVKVTRVQAGDNSSPVFWRQDGQVLRVDLGFKTVPRAGARVALITLKPSKPTTLKASKFYYESRDGSGKLLSELKPEEPAPPASIPTPPASTTDSPPSAPPTSPATPATSATQTPPDATPDAPQPTTTPAQDGTKK